MTLQARPQSLPLTVDDALLGTLALGVLEAENVRLEPLPREFVDELRVRLSPTTNARQVCTDVLAIQRGG